MDKSAQIFRRVLREEAQAIEKATERVKESEIAKLVDVFNILRTSGGKLVFCGVGKSGIIGKKLSSTFCSFGLPSFFLHPVEALHGDLGLLSPSDALVLISKSGTTEEIIKILPFIKNPKTMIIGLLGNVQSTLAESCSIVFDCSVEREACLNNQAPTTSTTVTMAVGDALAVLYQELVGLSKEMFAENHPGGLLGKSLRLKVKDILVPAKECPIVKSHQTLENVILEMTKFNVGLCAVIDQNDLLAGIVVEGDIRRTLMKKNAGLHSIVSDFMNTNPIVVEEDTLAYKALELMQNRKSKIYQLPVLSQKKFIGVLRLHDLLKQGFSE